jgi:hypothetical protein
VRRVLGGNDPMDQLFSNDYTYQNLINEAIFHIDEFDKNIEVAIDITLLESESTYGLDGYLWLKTIGKERSDFKRDVVQEIMKRMDS